MILPSVGQLRFQMMAEGNGGPILLKQGLIDPGVV